MSEKWTPNPNAKRGQRPIQAELRISFPHSSESGYRAEIEIRDRTSGMLLAEIELDAQQWLDISAGRGLTVPAVTTAYPQRIGKQVEHETVYYGPAPTGKGAQVAWDERMKTTMLAHMVQGGWETHREPARNNTGQVYVTYYRWVQPKENAGGDSS